VPHGTAASGGVGRRTVMGVSRHQLRRLEALRAKLREQGFFLQQASTVKGRHHSVRQFAANLLHVSWSACAGSAQCDCCQSHFADNIVMWLMADGMIDCCLDLECLCRRCVV
jgi:hypothetical protein